MVLPMMGGPHGGPYSIVVCKAEQLQETNCNRKKNHCLLLREVSSITYKKYTRIRVVENIEKSLFSGANGLLCSYTNWPYGQKVLIFLFCSDMRFGLNRPRWFRIWRPFFFISYRFWDTGGLRSQNLTFSAILDRYMAGPMASFK